MGISLQSCTLEFYALTIAWYSVNKKALHLGSNKPNFVFKGETSI